MVAKTGVARLALLAPEVPVIPVGNWGAQDSVDWYHHRFRLLPRKAVVLAVGRPVDTSAYLDQPVTPQALRAFTDAVMTDVRDEVAGIRGRVAPAELRRARRPEFPRRTGPKWTGPNLTGPNLTGPIVTGANVTGRTG